MADYIDMLQWPAMVVTITAASDAAKAEAAHEGAHHGCFVAASVNFPVRCEPRIVVEEPGIGNRA